MEAKIIDAFITELPIQPIHLQACWRCWKIMQHSTL
jgi:hypothetical protein